MKLSNLIKTTLVSAASGTVLLTLSQIIEKWAHEKGEQYLRTAPPETPIENNGRWNGVIYIMGRPYVPENVRRAQWEGLTSQQQWARIKNGLPPESPIPNEKKRLR